MNQRIKNAIYSCALYCTPSFASHDSRLTDNRLNEIIKNHKVVGGQITTFSDYHIRNSFYFGNKKLTRNSPVIDHDTVFRTASLTKSIIALLVFRLQSLNLLRIDEDISDFLDYTVRNPNFPYMPITLAMLLSHTSTITDCPAYYQALHNKVSLRSLLEKDECYVNEMPGTVFRYSNLAAGMIGSLLESRFKDGIESLCQKYLFEPLNVKASFHGDEYFRSFASDVYRVVPFHHTWSPSCSYSDLVLPDPDYHYIASAGSLMISADEFFKLLSVTIDPSALFLSENEYDLIRTPVANWSDTRMSHCMGFLKLNLKDVCSIWGHQGFAYGSVNGFFFDDHGNGFISLNNGADERRDGRMSLLNLDLIHWFWSTIEADHE